MIAPLNIEFRYMARRLVLLAAQQSTYWQRISELLTLHQLEPAIEHDPAETTQSVRDHWPLAVVLEVGELNAESASLVRSVGKELAPTGGALIVVGKRTDDRFELSAFESGADDYLIRPDNPQVLASRILARLRRVQSTSHQADEIVLGKLRIDAAGQKAFVGQNTLDLTATQFRILWFLARNRGRVISRLELLMATGGAASASQERTIDVHIRSLRSRLGEWSNLISTVRGVGYQIAEEVESAKV